MQMFEHMKNYETLLYKISSWLRPRARPNPNTPLTLNTPDTTNTPDSSDSPTVEKSGSGSEGEEGRGESLLFVQMFVHRDKPYHFEEDEGWMGRTFFSGMLPVPVSRLTECGF
jgi:hypothetical protein